MEQELGRPVAAVFSSISEGPIAAASLGQVYKAVLRDTGEEVAIKVRAPPEQYCERACGHWGSCASASVARQHAQAASVFRAHPSHTACTSRRHSPGCCVETCLFTLAKIGQ